MMPRWYAGNCMVVILVSYFMSILYTNPMICEIFNLQLVKCIEAFICFQAQAISPRSSCATGQRTLLASVATTLRPVQSASLETIQLL